MNTGRFLSKLHSESIIKAIRDAESKTSGEIRVFVSRKEPKDAVAAAQKAFKHLGMHKTKERNGVLIFIAPLARKFAIIGDAAVHAQCGDQFWTEVAQEIATQFRGGFFTDGTIHGIARAGKLLAEHFPRHPGDKNQLSDEVAHD